MNRDLPNVFLRDPAKVKLLEAAQGGNGELFVSSQRLTVTSAVANQFSRALCLARVIVLQHMKSDTEEYLRILEYEGAEIFHVIAKPNSFVTDVLDRVKSKYPLTFESYETLEKTDVLDGIVAAAIDKCKTDMKRLLILDVGGYFAKPVSFLAAKNDWPLAGVVEVTTFGHNRYEENLKKIQFPLFSVARSQIKEIEARFVGYAAANAIEELMRARGTILQGKQALVNGFGMIGRNVANAIRSKGMAVAVYDKQDFPKLDAATQGYRVGSKEKLLSEAEFLFSATAQQNSISEEDFDKLATGVHLVSVGSRTNEFDVDVLMARSKNRIEIAPHIETFAYKGKEINLIKQGKSVNFLAGSCQDEVIDLLFAEITFCFARLLKSPPKKLLTIYTSHQDDVNKICRLWLRYRKGF